MVYILGSAISQSWISDGENAMVIMDKLQFQIFLFAKTHYQFMCHIKLYPHDTTISHRVRWFNHYDDINISHHFTVFPLVNPFHIIANRVGG